MIFRIEYDPNWPFVNKYHVRRRDEAGVWRDPYSRHFTLRFARWGMHRLMRAERRRLARGAVRIIEQEEW